MVSHLLAIVFSGFSILQKEDIQVKTAPDRESEIYVKTQFAGNTGFISLGVGSFFFKDKFTADINYGFLPKFINDVSVHTLYIKPAYNIKKFTISPFSAYLYGGLNFVYSFGRHIYIKSPDHYPQDYYHGNSFHFNPFAGLKTGLGINNRYFKNLSIYTELGTVHYELWYALKNSEIKVNEILNLCIGFVFDLK